MSNFDETVYELVCDSCGSKYELVTLEESANEPIYCPFCGTDMDIEQDVDDLEYDVEDDYDELDFDDEY